MIEDAASNVCLKLCGVADPDALQWSAGGADGSYLKVNYDTPRKRQGVLNYFDKAKGKASRSVQTTDADIVERVSPYHVAKERARILIALFSMTSPLIAQPGSDEAASTGDRAGSSSGVGKATAPAAAAAGASSTQQYQMMTPREKTSSRTVYIAGGQEKQSAKPGAEPARAKTPPKPTEPLAKAKPKGVSEAALAQPLSRASTGDRAGAAAAQPPPPPKQAPPPKTADVPRLPAPRPIPKPAQPAPQQPQVEIVEEIEDWELQPGGASTPRPSTPPSTTTPTPQVRPPQYRDHRYFPSGSGSSGAQAAGAVAKGGRGKGRFAKPLVRPPPATLKGQWRPRGPLSEQRPGPQASAAYCENCHHHGHIARDCTNEPFTEI